jgi:broad specificity phosphatase PhoE
VSVALFIRHGKASAFGSPADYDNLSPPGVEQAEKLGEFLAARAGGRGKVDAVFVGPRKRHAQTLEGVTKVFAARGVPLPPAVLVPELDEHDGMGLVMKLLPQLASADPQLAALVEAMARGERTQPTDMLAAFKRVTRRWVTGEVGHPEVESWEAFRARIRRAMQVVGAIGRSKRAFVFTSAGAVASAAAFALDIVDEKRVLDLSWALYNGSITELEFRDDTWGLRTFNGTPHLPEALLSAV